MVQQIMTILPSDFNSRISILAQLQAQIMTDELSAARKDHRSREIASAQRATSMQQKNGELENENKRLRDELVKLDMIRTSVRDITTSSSVISVQASPGAQTSTSSSPLRSYDERTPSTDADLSMSELSRGGGGGGRPSYQYSSPRVQQHSDLLAAIDRRVVHSRVISPAASALRSGVGAESSRGEGEGGGGGGGGVHSGSIASPRGSPGSIASGKAFFRECRVRLEKSTFDVFISDIRTLKVNAVSREKVYEKASKLFGDQNHDLIDQLRSLLYSV